VRGKVDLIKPGRQNKSIDHKTQPWPSVHTSPHTTAWGGTSAPLDTWVRVAEACHPHGEEEASDLIIMPRLLDLGRWEAEHRLLALG